MAPSQTDRTHQARAFWATGLGHLRVLERRHVFWRTVSVGSAHRRPIQTLGLDAAFPAGYLVLIGPHLRSRAGRQAALLAALMVLVTTPFLRPGMPILVAALAILVGLAGSRPKDRGAGAAVSWWPVLAARRRAPTSARSLGLVVIGGRPLPARVQACLALIPAAMLSALIVANTVTLGQHLVIDARLPGVLAAAVAAWRKLAVPRRHRPSAQASRRWCASRLRLIGRLTSGGDAAGCPRPRAFSLGWGRAWPKLKRPAREPLQAEPCPRPGRPGHRRANPVR